MFSRNIKITKENESTNYFQNMNVEKLKLLGCVTTFLITIMWLIPQISAFTITSKDVPEIKLEPAEALVFVGDTVTFTCSFPTNVTLKWDFTNDLHPSQVTKGVTTINDTDSMLYWSRITFTNVKRIMSGHISCSIEGNPQNAATAFLIVNGIKIGGVCERDEDCLSDKAMCSEGKCECPPNHILLRLTESKYEVCRKMIYKLYDPCEFNEQCFHLVDRKSVCAATGLCVCASWAVDINGKCIPKSEISYTRNQEMYRVGLIAITCIIIVVVAAALWITLRRSCHGQNTDGQRRSITDNTETDNVPDDTVVDISGDKPPSYDDALEKCDTVGSPPDFKDALKNSMTAKKLLRQVSAPAGQLLTGTTSTPQGKLNFSFKPD